jgi:hypothetical protein
MSLPRSNEAAAIDWFVAKLLRSHLAVEFGVGWSDHLAGRGSLLITDATFLPATMTRHNRFARHPRPIGLDSDECYIVTNLVICPRSGHPPKVAMPTHVHHAQHHHHPPGQGHPPAAVSPSILRMSILQRLAIAAALIVLLWGAVAWAMMV